MKSPQTRNGKMRKTFSEKFKFLRQTVLQLKQEEIGVLLEITQGFVSDIETDFGGKEDSWW